MKLPFQLESENVVLEFVKKAEREEATILRLYEPYGRRAEMDFLVNLDRAKAVETIY